LREQIEDLDSRIAALRETSKPLRDQLANIDRTSSKLGTERAALVAKLEEMKAKPRVSDHAVLRYLERKYNFSFEDVREELLTPFVLQAMDIGAESVRMNGGSLKLKGRTVVTYLDSGK
jgi:predicted nuclease with TOPRIM domain